MNTTGTGESALVEWGERLRRKEAGRIRHARKIPREIREQVLWQEYRCRYCGDISTVVDHILPVVRGGTRRRRNLAGACQPCNSEKLTMTPEEWRDARLKAGRAWPPRATSAVIAELVESRNLDAAAVIADPVALDRLFQEAGMIR